MLFKNIDLYYDFLYKSSREKNVKKKIQLLEKQLILLPDLVSSSLSPDSELYMNDLPPVIPCRDELPELYMRLGDWGNAVRVIKTCIIENAYYPENGEVELNYLLLYSKTAKTALEYISLHPGVLQKNIYKILQESGINTDILKHFIRCSMQIKKEPFQKTNKLFIVSSSNKI